MRENYPEQPICQENLLSNPFEQFQAWFTAAITAKIAEPNAFSLATLSENKQPNLRTVLLKSFNEAGFVFYTNFESAKASDIEQNPAVAMLFPWVSLYRQVKILGTAEKVSDAEALEYFHSRPIGSQIGAWASPQSKVIPDRAFLEERRDAISQEYANKTIPLPPHWGGYRIIPHLFEFWQGRRDRLHDRFQYRLSTNKTWLIERLAP